MREKLFARAFRCIYTLVEGAYRLFRSEEDIAPAFFSRAKNVS